METVNKDEISKDSLAVQEVVEEAKEIEIESEEHLKQHREDCMRKDFTQIGKSLNYMIVLQLAVGLILGMYLSREILKNINSSTIFDLDGYINKMFIFMGVILVITTLLTLVVAHSAKRKLHIASLDVQKLSKLSRQSVLKYTAVMLGLSAIVTMIMQLLGFQDITGATELIVPDNAIYMICLILSTVVFAPIFEELLFRGIICKTIMKYDARHAIVISAIVFGIMHMNFFQSIAAFFIGLVLAYVYVKSGSLKMCIMMHAINNAIAVIGALLVMKGYVSETLILIVDGALAMFAIYFCMTHRTIWKEELPKKKETPSMYGLFFGRWSNIVFLILAGIMIVFGLNAASSIVF